MIQLKIHDTKSIYETHAEVRQTLHKQELSIVTDGYSHIMHLYVSFPAYSIVM